MKGKELIRGITGSPGIAVGYVKIIDVVDEENKIEPIDILVINEFHYDGMEKYLKVAAALVQNKGGRTSYGAVACRGLQKPCIVGTVSVCGKLATEVLKESNVIIVEGFTDYKKDEQGNIIYNSNGAPLPLGAVFQYLPDEPGAPPLIAKVPYLSKREANRKNST